MSILDDARIHSVDKSDQHHLNYIRHYVYATFVEDSSQIDLESTPFSYQTHVHPDDARILGAATYCPLCNDEMHIYIIHKCLDSHVNMCTFCPECELLFRAVVIGTLDDYGNFTAWESVL